MKPKTHPGSSGVDRARHPQSKRARVESAGSPRASASAVAAAATSSVNTNTNSQHEEFAVGDHVKMPFMLRQLERNRKVRPGCLSFAGRWAARSITHGAAYLQIYDLRCKRKGRKPLLLITDLPAGLRHAAGWQAKFK
jgi:hypothetical protein